MVFQSCSYIRISKKNKYMKKLFTLLLVLAGVSAVNAQNNFCGTDENFHRLAAKYPEILQSHNELEAMTKWITQNKGSLSVSRSGAFVVPVVFHILHDGGKEYLSNDMVESQVLYLNQYWNKSNPELPSVTALYQPVVANMGVEFRLAHLDPQGNCTDGIDRIMSFATNVGNNNTKLNPWPPDKYLNIWVNKSVERDSSNYGTIAFSMYPVNVQTWVNNEIIDGVITKIAGVNGGPIGRSTLAHEVGHWLNLKHVWGDTNSPGVSCGDDDVDDTPITKGQSSGCSTSVIECGNTVASNVQNIMNYSSCEYMFTEGQKTRSLIALQSSISNRNNLFSDVNLAATGVEPLSSCLPAPKAEYGTNKRFACVGESLHFTDFTYNTPQWDRTWSFPADATGASTTDSSQFVSFSTPGWKEVTLVSSNPSGSSTRTKSNVYIADASAGDLPYPHFESFDDPNVAQSWIGINYDNNQTVFTHRTTLGHNSNGCFGLNNYDARYEGDRDELITPSFDLTGIAAGDYRLSFDYSMATRLEQDINDSTVSLEILATTNCGTSWKRVGSLTASKLLNGGFTVNPYYPSKGDQYWRRAVVDLTAQGAQFKTAGVRFKFAVTANKLGNNFYFDNFNLGNSTLGIDGSALNMDIDLYPNPTKESALLDINTEKPEKITVVLNDLLGNKVIDLFNGEIDVNKKITIPTSTLSSGMYIVQIQSNGKIIQKKLTKM
jgi:hypothetical protein